MEIFPFKTSHDGTTFERNLTYDEANEVRKFIRLLEQGRVETPQKQVAVQGTIEDYATPELKAVVDLSTDKGRFIYECWKEAKRISSLVDWFQIGEVSRSVRIKVEGNSRPGNLLRKERWWNYFFESQGMPVNPDNEKSEERPHYRLREDKAEEFQNFRLETIQGLS